MRLPNLVQFKPVSQKRRIGMRLPNIIYLRSEPEKKNTWERAAVPAAEVSSVAEVDGTSRNREELQQFLTPFWISSRMRNIPTPLRLASLRGAAWL